MACADMLDELQQHVESIDMANGNVYIVSYVCARMRVTRVRTCTHTHTLVVCEHVLEYCFICIALADLYYTNNMMAYIYPCSTSIFTHKMLVDGLS